MTVSIVFILILPMGWFVGTLSNEAFEFYDRTRDAVSLKQIQAAIESDSVWAQRIKRFGSIIGVEFTPQAVQEFATSVGKNVGLFLYKQLSSAASNALSFLIHFFLMMLMIFYFFRDGHRLKEYISQLLPVPPDQVQKMVDKFHEMGRAVIVGNGLSGIVQGVLGGLGFFFFGLHAPFLWGTVIAFMAFLPIIGASVVFVPTTIILVATGSMGKAVGFLLYNLLYSSAVEYVVKPRVIGKGMQMNALLVFIGIIGGMKLFGILGLIYGPLIIMIFTTLAEIYRLEYKEQAC
jgi:predicted PurR-regulated permease PerM